MEAIVPSIDAIKRNVVERANANGRVVNVFTVEQWHLAERLVRLGVNGMISNYPQLWDFGRQAGLSSEASGRN